LFDWFIADVGLTTTVALHAATRVMASDRRGLWRLCAYGARGAVASSRLSELPDGRFAYDMKRALPDGRRQLVMTGVELLEKLVPLIPPAYANLTRFHGVFAPTSRLRDKVVPRPAPRARTHFCSSGNTPLFRLAPRGSQSGHVDCIFVATDKVR
jgi:hypothetical protein